MAQSNLNEELLHIRKRARRRLVGAIALVVFALTVLWTVLDNAPPPQFSPGHAVEIISSAPALQPGQAAVVAVVQTASGPAYLRPPVDAGEVMASVPSTAPAADSGRASQVSSTASSPSILPGRLVNQQVKPSASPKPTKTPAPKVERVDPRKILDGVEESKPAAQAGKKTYLRIGAFSDTAKARQLLKKLKDEGFPVESEVVKNSKGQVLTRVLVGPSANNAKTEDWERKIKNLRLQSERLVR